MSTEPSISNMSLQDLRQIIRDEIASQLRQLQPRSPHEVEEAMNWLDENMIIPAPGTPSSTELLREDRDQ